MPVPLFKITEAAAKVTAAAEDFRAKYEAANGSRLKLREALADMERLAEAVAAEPTPPVPETTA